VCLLARGVYFLMADAIKGAYLMDYPEKVKVNRACDEKERAIHRPLATLIQDAEYAEGV